MAKCALFLNDASKSGQKLLGSTDPALCGSKEPKLNDSTKNWSASMYPAGWESLNQD